MAMKFYSVNVLLLLSVFLASCTATTGSVPTMDQPIFAESTGADIQTAVQRETPTEVKLQSKGFNNAAEEIKKPTELKTNSQSTVELSAVVQHQKNRDSLEDINQQITLASVEAGFGQTSTINREDYRIGPDDVLEIAVFLVDDLNKTVRVTGDGYILLPLLGAIRVSGKTTTEVQSILVRDLGEKYLQNPHVTVFITEYRSHQVAILGAVNKPNIYNIQQPRSVLEMLSKAGGLSPEAGNKVRIQRNVIDQESGERRIESVIVGLRTLLERQNPKLDFLLSAGDSVMIPKAGTVFVEGAVDKPGAYQLQGYTNVLKALAMAGGAKFEARKGAIQIFRQPENGQSEIFEVSLKEIRNNQREDILLEDGDIVVVRNNAFKKGVAGVWDGVAQIFNVGKSL